LISTAIAVWSLCIVSPAQSSDPWNVVRSNHFSIVGNAAPEQLRVSAERLEQFRWAFSRLYPQMKLDNGKPTKIVVFRDAAAYFDFLPRRPDGSADVGVAGYFQAGDDTNYITFAVSQRQPDPLSTAIHEYVHSVIDSNFDRSQLAPWLSEGLAEYFETLRVDGKKIILGEPQADHLRLLRRSGLVPLAEFLSLKTSDLRAMSPERRRLFYAESWAVVYLLMRQRSISLKDLESARNLKTSDRLANELDDLIAGSTGKPETVAVDQPMPETEPLVILPMALSLVSATLGDLLLHTGELTRSEPFLRNALTDDADQPLANAALGQLLLKSGKTAEARPYLEKAVSHSSTNHLVLIGYAFSLLEPLAKNGAEISDETADKIRSLLKRAASAEPRYTESFRLMALLNYLRDEDLDGAIAQLQKVLAISAGDQDAQLLLARILLRREEIDRAREIAEQIAANATDSKRKSEASEIVKATYEYSRAKAVAAQPMRMDIALGGRQGLVILKRSWLTDADVARIDEERVNNNFNRIILRPFTGEMQIVGRVENITCTDATINYRVSARDGSVIALTSRDFSSVRMTVAKEGESTFQIGCDMSLKTELAVINYLPLLVPVGNKSIGELTAISFVPRNFRLKTIAEMSAARLIAIDDDIARRSGRSSDINSETIYHSISQSLRRPQNDERRVVGTVEQIDCSSDGVVFQISADGKTYRLAQSKNSRPDIGWFTVAASQLPVSCGSGPLAAKTLITFLPDAQRDGIDGTIRAIEFVPNGFTP
jgi:tetratricopeptide (TPR) repeat protein